MHLESATLVLFLDLAFAASLPWDLSKSDAHGREQKLLSNGSPKKYAAPVKSWNGLVHTINITIGTPPQPFNVSLDLTGNGFTVPSIDCDRACRSWVPRNVYWANISTTYEPNGTKATVDYWGNRYNGKLARDDVHLGGLEVKNETFLPYDDRNAVSFFGLDYGFDGMLGLSPPWHQRRAEYGYNLHPNFLTYLQDQAVLEENVMAWKLPHKLEEEGEIMFGGINPDLYTGEFRTVPILNNTGGERDSDNTWNIPIDSVTFNTSIPLHWPLENYTALIVSEPIIILPTNLTKAIHETIGAEEFNYLWGTVPCDRVPYLPELTFTIGGQNFTITARDYTFEWEMPFGFAPACVTWFGDEDRWSAGPEHQVVLGASFLKAFYSVFDFENKEMRFADLKK